MVISPGNFKLRGLYFGRGKTLPHLVGVSLQDIMVSRGIGWGIVLMANAKRLLSVKRVFVITKKTRLNF